MILSVVELFSSAKTNGLTNKISKNNIMNPLFIISLVVRDLNSFSQDLKVRDALKIHEKVVDSFIDVFYVRICRCTGCSRHRNWWDGC